MTRPSDDGYAYKSAMDGAWLCGHDFMAGTICSLRFDHEGPHAPICHVCDVDWYENSGCACWQPDDDED